jgi:hypothetical protein
MQAPEDTCQTAWQRFRDMSAPRTIKGYVAALPVSADETKAGVAVEENGIMYHVIRRGAGVDLDDHLSALVQVTGLVQQDEDENWLINVRAYELLEDDSWLEDE